MYEYTCIIERVVDGDTIDVFIDLGFSLWIRERVRLHGIDTPETRTKDLREKKFGLMAKARVEELLPVDSEQTILTFKNTGKFGRILADFVLPGRDYYQNRNSVATTLIEERLAVNYYGGNKEKMRKNHEKHWDYLESREPSPYPMDDVRLRSEIEREIQ